MNTIEASVLKTCLQWIKEEKEFYLCTIISAKGASVRPLGSLFIFDGENKVGFISELRSDDAFCELLKTDYFKDDINYFTYGNQLLNKDNLLTLPCCGNVSLMIEKISSSTKQITTFTQWNDLIESKINFKRVLNKNTNLSSFEKTGSSLSFKDSRIDNQEEFIEINYSCIQQILIIGATPVSKHLAKLSKDLGFIVRLCENRKLFLDNLVYEGESDNYQLSKLPSNIFVKNYVNRHTAIVSLAHDPLIDDEAIKEALNSESFYIGAIGSKKNCEKRIKRLEDYGLSKTRISTLRAPIGLKINSKTPYEIAISIIAEIISLKYTL